MELTLGKEQVFTSKRMIRYPWIGKLVSTIFGYTNIGNYARFTIFKKAVTKLPLDNFHKMLDLGCGYGEYAMGLARSHPKAQIHALDVDNERTKVVQSAVEACNIKNMHVHTSYIESLQQTGFDFIFSVDVFEHIAPHEMPFLSCFEKLKPGGYFMVKIPSDKQLTILPDNLFEDHHQWLEDEHIGQVFDLAGLEHRFVETGFEIVSSHYSDGTLSRLGWELAYLGKKAGVVTQLISIPISKGLIHLDRAFHTGNWGNAIHVVGRKPLTA